MIEENGSMMARKKEKEREEEKERVRLERKIGWNNEEDDEN